MKKIFTILSIVCMALVFSSCGTDDNQAEEKQLSMPDKATAMKINMAEKTLEMQIEMLEFQIEYMKWALELDDNDFEEWFVESDYRENELEEWMKSEKTTDLRKQLERLDRKRESFEKKVLDRAEDMDLNR